MDLNHPFGGANYQELRSLFSHLDLVYAVNKTDTWQ